MNIKCIFFFLIQLCLANEFKLLWAPLNLKTSPFLSIFNDLHNPSWKTKNIITKKRVNMGDLIIPTNFSFSIICGGCIDARSFNIRPVKLRAVITNNLFTEIPILTNKKSSFHYNQNVKCLMNFIYVRKIRSGGEIKCTLFYGKRVINESVPFDIRGKIESNLVNQSLLQGDEYISCPEFGKSKHLATTWSLDEGKSVIPITDSKILLEKYNDRIKNKITCIRYDMTRGTHVKQVIYRRRHRLGSNDERDYNNCSSRASAIIISVVMIFLLFFFILLCIIFLVNHLK